MNNKHNQEHYKKPQSPNRTKYGSGIIFIITGSVHLTKIKILFLHCKIKLNG